MAYDYDMLYGSKRNALGTPSQAIVDFFEELPAGSLRVLDVGCGQGRDALFIARMGHRVVGVDLSANGIRDLREAAKREDLNIEGIIADISTFVPEGAFDVLLFDRTLHMLPEGLRLDVFKRLINCAALGGWVLIADESSNIGGFKSVITDDVRDWSVKFEKRGFVFFQCS